MNLKELIVRINRSVEEIDLVTTRKYIEENLTVLNQNKSLLKGNARSLLDFLTKEKESGAKPLTRQELAAIKTINTYATRFDIRGLKMYVKDKSDLLLRNDIVQYLNTDARILLEGMGAIEKSKGVEREE